MGARLQPVGHGQRYGRVGAAGHDVGASKYLAGMVDCLGLQPVLFGDLTRVSVAVLFGWTEDLDAANTWSSVKKGRDVAARHAARTEHADHPRVLLSHV